MRAIAIGTCIWTVSALCSAAAIAYTFVAHFTTPVQELTILYTRALVLGFLPWLLAYAATRVLYGVETSLHGSDLGGRTLHQ